MCCVDHRPVRRVVEVLGTTTRDGWVSVLVLLECGCKHIRTVRSTWKNPAPRQMRCGRCSECKECRQFFWYDLVKQREVNDG